MPNHDPQNDSLDISDLNEKARAGEISIGTYFDELERRGITGLRQAMSAARAFGIGLGEAKLAFVERQTGGIEAWEAQFDEIDIAPSQEEVD